MNRAALCTYSYNDDKTKAMVERQVQLEQEYRTRGLDRSQKLMQEAIQEQRVSTLPAAQRLIAAAYDTVAAEIDKTKAEKVPGVGGRYRAFLRLAPTNVLAAMSLTKCMDMMTCGNGHNARSSAQSVMAALGRLVQSEILSIQLRAVAPAYMNRVHEYLKERHTRDASHILQTYRASAENVHYGHEPWSNSQCIAVGRFLMQAVYSTGLFEWVKGSDASQLSYLSPSERVRDILQDLVQNADLITFKPPMLVPPLKHETLFSGGYLTEIDRRGTYKNSQITRRQLREVADAFREAHGIKEALNRAQEVPYRVNTDILGLVRKAQQLGVGVGMPSTKPAPKPEWYLDGVPKESYDDKQLEEFQEWKLLMREWYNQEQTRVSQLRQVSRTLQMCEEFKDEEALYFPTCVDWRYRLYFKSSLHPQGSDLQKALLCFGRGKALGTRGLFWLKVHVATCFGYDKTLFEDRAAWVDANYDIIESAVNDPLDSESFKLADSPWCFLAGCIELVNAVRSGSPELYVSHIPVAMDATNSGGQHFSGMLRDPIGGRLTNLYWEGNEQKADLYMDVKQRTDSKIIMDLSNPDYVVQAQYWTENPITRSMTKRPSMTYFYSATVRSCSEYIVVGAKDEGYKGTDEYTLWRLSGYLAPRMRQSIEESNPAAAAAMHYCQQIARRVPVKLHLQWKTPLGGLVINRYTEKEEQRVRIDSMNLSLLLAYNRNFEVNNRKKAASGIAPNFVHSLDSTHLMMVINNFDGDIVPIHDSLATHACDVDAMHRVIREQFVKLYEENDPLQVLTDAALAAGANLDDIEMPEKGSLDLRRVLDSKFFFC